LLQLDEYDAGSPVTIPPYKGGVDAFIRKWQFELDPDTALIQVRFYNYAG